MGVLTPNLTEAVKAVRATPRPGRTAKVNEYMAGAAVGPEELAWRAWFVSALREADVWPAGRRT